MSINQKSPIRSGKAKIKNPRYDRGRQKSKIPDTIGAGKIQNPKTIGAALLITMLVIATIGVIALAVGRIVLSELRITTNYADSVIAYQAAEAGIERGLLEFRFNRNIEGYSTDGIPQHTDFNTTLNNTASYNLKISFRDQSELKDKVLKKDESIELDVSNDPFPIEITWDGKLGSTGQYKGWVEWRILGENDTEWHLIPAASTTPPPANDPPAAVSGFGSISPAVVSNPQILRIKFLSTDLEPDPSKEVAITYTLTSQSVPPQPLDSGKTTISSTGIFGSTQRKLKATVDRKTGTILDIFDYTLYAGQGFIEGS